MQKLDFTISKKAKNSKARLGTIKTAHGVIETPVFIPVGTRGSVKTVTNRELVEIGTEIILANTYHLMLRPGIDVIALAGGLHSFMSWDKPILTDSGGFQVFSLSELNKTTDEGVHFQSHIDGTHLFLGPKESMEMQKTLGADFAMCFDACPPYPADEETLTLAVKRTIAWAGICKNYPLLTHQNLFGIVQGGVDPTLRAFCAKELVKMDFAGYALGGLSVGEPAELIYQTIDHVEPYLPEEKPRYLMGVGSPRNIVEAVKRGIDMFDCVLPTRRGRHGMAYTWQGRIQIKAARYAKDFSPLDTELDSYASHFSKAYIRYLLHVDEITGLTLVTLQNLAFYLDFMRKLHNSIREDTFDEFYQKIVTLFPT
jgi:queuine tRNA-ribosyltransferase